WNSNSRRDLDGFAVGYARASRSKTGEARSGESAGTGGKFLHSLAERNFRSRRRQVFCESVLCRPKVSAIKFRTALLSYLFAHDEPQWRIIRALGSSPRAARRRPICLRPEPWPVGRLAGFAR